MLETKYIIFCEFALCIEHWPGGRIPSIALMFMFLFFLSLSLYLPVCRSFCFV